MRLTEAACAKGERWRIVDQKLQRLQTETLEEALYEVDLAFGTYAMEARPDLLQLHGGGVSRGGRRTILVLGGPRAGKTTLLAGLLGRGFEYVADELLFLHPERLAVIPFRRGIFIREAALKEVRAVWPAATLSYAYTKDDGTRRYLPAPGSFQQAPTREVAAPYLLIFPAYRAESARRIELLPLEEVFGRLLSQTLNLAGHGFAGVSALARLAESAPAYEITASSLRDAVACVESVLHA
ncbi:MAG: hypothetical protein HYY96_10940 [Candidatus Tectomicrobia bacterium]|nr:hypothetical protein [Candidatus Tectomicrobia bacterium]